MKIRFLTLLFLGFLSCNNGVAKKHQTPKTMVDTTELKTKPYKKQQEI